jgi:hypothetical protein
VVSAQRDAGVHGTHGCAVKRPALVAGKLSAECGMIECGMGNELPEYALNRNRHPDIDKLNLRDLSSRRPIPHSEFPIPHFTRVSLPIRLRPVPARRSHPPATVRSD